MRSSANADVSVWRRIVALSIIVSMVLTFTCEDMHSECKMWKRNMGGSCNFDDNDYMLENCPQTCGLCAMTNTRGGTHKSKHEEMAIKQAMGYIHRVTHGDSPSASDFANLGSALINIGNVATKNRAAEWYNHALGALLHAQKHMEADGDSTSVVHVQKNVNLLKHNMAKRRVEMWAQTKLSLDVHAVRLLVSDDVNTAQIEDTECDDKSKQCPVWKQRMGGNCSGNDYEFMFHTCPKTCGLCAKVRERQRLITPLLADFDTAPFNAAALLGRGLPPDYAFGETGEAAIHRHFLAGRAFDRAHKWSHALRAFRALVRISDSSDNWNSLGVVLMHMPGREAESAACFEQVLQMNPGHKIGLSNLLMVSPRQQHQRARTLLKYVYCQGNKKSCYVSYNSSSPELQNLFPRGHGIDEEMEKLQASHFDHASLTQTHWFEVRRRRKTILFLKLWLKMGNISAPLTFVFNAIFNAMIILAIYVLGVVVLKLYRAVPNRRSPGSELHQQTETDMKSSSIEIGTRTNACQNAGNRSATAARTSNRHIVAFSGVRAICIIFTVVGHWWSYWRSPARFTFSVADTEFGQRIFGLIPATDSRQDHLNFLFMPMAWLNVMHLTVSMTFTMAGFVAALPLFPLKHANKQINVHANTVPAELVSVYSTLRWSVHFYGAKLRRIWVPLACILLFVHFLESGNPERMSFKQFVVENTLLIETHMPAYFRPGLWSLRPYAQFVVLAPFLLFVAARWPRFALVVVMLLSHVVRSVHGIWYFCSEAQVAADGCALVNEGGAHTFIADHHLFWSPDQIFGRLDDFFSGIVTCIILHRGRSFLSSTSARMMAILGLFSYFSGCVLWNMSQLGVYMPSFVFASSNTLLWTGNSLVLASLARTQLERCQTDFNAKSYPCCPLDTFFRFAPLRHLGSLQYSIYLVHMSLTNGHMRMMGEKDGKPPYPQNAAKNTSSRWECFLCTLPTLIKLHIASLAFHHIVERSWMRLIVRRMYHRAASLLKQTVSSRPASKMVNMKEKAKKP